MERIRISSDWVFFEIEVHRSKRLKKCLMLMKNVLISVLLMFCFHASFYYCVVSLCSCLSFVFSPASHLNNVNILAASGVFFLSSCPSLRKQDSDTKGQKWWSTLGSPGRGRKQKGKRFDRGSPESVGWFQGLGFWCLEDQVWAQVHGDLMKRVFKRWWPEEKSFKAITVNRVLNNEQSIMSFFFDVGHPLPLFPWVKLLYGIPQGNTHYCGCFFFFTVDTVA